SERPPLCSALLAFRASKGAAGGSPAVEGLTEDLSSKRRSCGLRFTPITGKDDGSAVRVRPLSAGPRAHAERRQRAADRVAREGEAAGAGQGVDPRGAGRRVPAA